VYHRGLSVAKRITIQLVGAQDDKGDVRFADFIDQLRIIKQALNERERLVSHTELSQIEYKVVDLHHSATTIVLEAIPLNGAKEYVDKVVIGFSNELRSIRRERKIVTGRILFP
jgi:hypothetical protein